MSLVTHVKLWLILLSRSQFLGRETMNQSSQMPWTNRTCLGSIGLDEYGSRPFVFRMIGSFLIRSCQRIVLSTLVLSATLSGMLRGPYSFV
ncbi:hypothetical protein FBUS_11444 [Fasciolopsis buskii]|uniref:Uncharacterized protein n=1 Tax=Fasciolopsis buskii TaxID=27845 RepID=A0A8E0RUU9_9TREM|nr:hypothetical protein FBUS_11444 [Fasciolopsis buski]